MKSNKSLFNATLFKSNIIRFLPFSILFFIIETIIYPLSIFANFNRVTSRLALSDFAVINIASEAFTFIFAGAFAILVFGYLFTANKCNAIHAFPIGRKALFTTNALSGYALLVVPQLLGFGIALPGIIMFAEAKELKAILLLGITSIFLFSFIVFSFAVISIMLSGNAFSGMVIYGVINFIYAALIMISSYSFSLFGTGLNADSLIERSQFLLSPVFSLVIHTPSVEFTERAASAVNYYTLIIVYFAVSLAIFALAYYLYKKRELEVAGEMAAFEIELPFLRVLASIVGGALISFFIGLIFEFEKYGYIALYIIFSFILYFATQMILKKKFNIFSGKLIAKWLLCCAISLGIVIAASVYQTNYIPETRSVKNANLNITYSADFRDTNDIKLVEELHKELIDYSKKSDKSNTSDGIIDKEIEYNPDALYLDTKITYTLKNGREITRTYSYNGDNEKIDSLIKALESKETYTNIFDYLDNLGARYTVKSISVIDYEQNPDGSKQYNINSGDFDKFTALCRDDVNILSENYSSLINATESYNSSVNSNVEIYFSCTVDKNTDKKVIEELTSSTENFNEGYFYCWKEYDTERETETKSYSLELYVTKLPKTSKTMEFLKQYKNVD